MVKLYTLENDGKLEQREYNSDQYTLIRIEANGYCLCLHRKKEKDYSGSHKSESSSDTIYAIADDEIVVLNGHFAGITSTANYIEQNGHGKVTEQGRRCILTEQAAALYPEADAKVIRTGEFYADDDHIRRDETKLSLLPFSLKNAILSDEDFSGILLLAKPALSEIVYHLMQKYSKEEVSYEHAQKMCSTEGINAIVVLVDGCAVAYAAFRAEDWEKLVGIECYGVEENLGISNDEFFALMG